MLERESKLVSGEEKRDRREEGDDISVAASLTDSEEAGEGRGAKSGEGSGKAADDDMKPKEDGKTKYPPLNSAFVTFNQQIAAHMGLQVLTHHEPYR